MKVGGKLQHCIAICKSKSAEAEGKEGEETECKGYGK